MFGEVIGGAAPVSTGLVPIRFVWNHGGRRVHLCGSFTRWQQTVPMSPMEGLPSVFEVVCRLHPGYHQYKFMVDGEWRHDDQLPVMSDPLGNVANWVLAREPELVQVAEGLGHLGANMHVDHDMAHQAGPGHDDQHHQVHHNGQEQFLFDLPALSDADAQGSRERIADG